LAFPLIFVPLILVLAAGGFYYYREESTKRKVARREKALVALGKEFEKEYGDYLGIAFIGQGAMGVVEKGVRKDRLSADGIAAIKTILLRNLEAFTIEEKEERMESAIDRFRREAKILQSTNHPNIPRLYEWGEKEKELYIVMEFLDGRDLEDYLKENGDRLSVPEIREIFSQLSSALDYLHQRGVFHRDLKPANIQRTEGGKIKILDFGLAISAQATKRITKAGDVMGTLDYMAPEALLGNEPDASFDQFAVGVIVFQMLTGSLPLAHITNPTLGDYIQPRRSVKECDADISDEIAAVVDKMLSLDPKDRFESVHAAFEAFEQAGEVAHFST
ncbi:MAG: serine/threonine-protein kinase, partial [Vulcanimicrobiota bacterium]